MRVLNDSLNDCQTTNVPEPQRDAVECNETEGEYEKLKTIANYKFRRLIHHFAESPLGGNLVYPRQEIFKAFLWEEGNIFAKNGGRRKRTKNHIISKKESHEGKESPRIKFYWTSKPKWFSFIYVNLYLPKTSLTLFFF